MLAVLRFKVGATIFINLGYPKIFIYIMSHEKYVELRVVIDCKQLPT
jgi:hypothetical protein